MHHLILHSVMVTQGWTARNLALDLTEVHQAQKALLIYVVSRNKCFPTKLEFYLKKSGSTCGCLCYTPGSEVPSAMIDLLLNTKTHFQRKLRITMWFSCCQRGLQAFQGYGHLLLHSRVGPCRSHPTGTSVIFMIIIIFITTTRFIKL